MAPKDKAEKLTKTNSTKILGAYSASVTSGNLSSDEFLPQLRGRKAIKKYREMRNNDATVGATMYAVEQILRDVKLKVEPNKKTSNKEGAKREADFVESIFEDMDHTLDDHISEAISCLPYGFSLFETVYKLREGPTNRSPKKRSKYSDGRYGIRRLSVRSPWSINHFKFATEDSLRHSKGDLIGFYQDGVFPMIPMTKALHYRTTALNGDPSGRSILRNAYTSYEMLNMAQMQEAIGIERDLSGIPIIEVPADYLAADASDDKKAVVATLSDIGRDLKNNEQAFALLPSDVYTDSDGKPSNVKLVNIRLMGSDSTRSYDVDKVIRRYQHDIARSVLSEFIMLGTQGGSYALSKSKTDLFLRALESYIQSIVDVLNKQLIEALWELNNLDYDLMPKIVAGDVADWDLKELGSYIRNLNGAGIPIKDQVDMVDGLMSLMELPPLNREVYAESLERERATEDARNDYYDGPDGVVDKGNKNEASEID